MSPSEATAAKVDWRTIYGEKQVLFVDGVGVGDWYAAGNGAFRVRLWSRYRVSGGAEQLVLTPEKAREVLVGMFEERLRSEGSGE
jgi:hypothetical protein